MIYNFKELDIKQIILVLSDTLRILFKALGTIEISLTGDTVALSC